MPGFGLKCIQINPGGAGTPSMSRAASEDPPATCSVPSNPRSQTEIHLLLVQGLEDDDLAEHSRLLAVWV